MPELPEVETIRRGLSRLIIGKEVTTVTHDTPKSFPNAESDVHEFLIGSVILEVRRRAKVLLIDLDTQYSLIIHLKMTGQLVWDPASSRQASFRGRSEDREFTSPSSGGVSPSLRFGAGHPNNSLVGELPDKSTRVEFTFADGSKLFFNDQRKFGWIRLIPSQLINAALTASALEPNARKRRRAQQAVETLLPESTGAVDAAVGRELSQTSKLGLVAGESGADVVIDFMKKVGPEPLEDGFTPEQFTERFKRRSRTSIKAALLDQTVIAGVGNIYADESLWGAKIHPQRSVGSITDEEFGQLFAELRVVMNLAIEKGGSTDRSYVNAEGKKGSYLSFARVFRREGQSCPRCGTTIIKFRAAGRGTHICPQCQVL